MKRQATDLEKMFANHISDKGLLCRIYWEPSKVNRKTIQLENGQKIWRGISPKEEIHMVNKHMKRCSTSLSIRAMQIKPQWGVTAHLSEWLKWKIVIIPNVGNEEKLSHAYIACGNVKWSHHSGKEYGSFLLN